MNQNDTEHASHLDMPRTPEQLAHSVNSLLGLQVPQSPSTEGRCAPFEYLVHAFFEGRWHRKDSAWQRATEPLSPDCVVWANRGGGKTALGAAATAMDLAFKPGIEIRILGGSLEQSKRMHAHLRTLFARPQLLPLLDGRITERRIRLKNGSSVELLAQSEASVRGTRVQKLRCDEVELFDHTVWEAAQLTTRSADLTTPDGDTIHVPGVIECLSTMHRPFGIMADIVDDPARRVFRWGVIDVLAECADPPEGRACEDERGPCPLLPECAGRAKAKGRTPGHISVRDAISLKSRVSSDAWDAEMLCIRPSRSDSVYPEFNTHTHVISDTTNRTATTTAKQTWIAGMDFGFRGLTVVLLAHLHTNGTLTVVEEHALAERRLSDHLDAIDRWPSLAWIGVDPAGLATNDQTARSNVDLLKERGHTVRWARRTIESGIAMVRSRLAPASASPSLFIHERCTSLVQAMQRYHYDPEDPASRNPVKDGPDHACDALRYMVSNLEQADACKVTNYALPR